jgi:hypothetical protein
MDVTFPNTSDILPMNDILEAINRLSISNTIAPTSLPDSSNLQSDAAHALNSQPSTVTG